MDTTRIITLKRALDDFPFWGIAPPLDIKSLHSGLTNRSYLLVTAKGDYILRLNNSNAYRLGISRRNEQRVLEAIEGEDFAPHTVYICPSYSYILTARIQGESFLDKAPSAKELEELDQALEAQNKSAIEEEFGDVLFSLINYARFININPETALERTNKKFIKRFQYIEDKAKASKRSIADLNLDEMEALWQEAKSHSTSGS